MGGNGKTEGHLQHLGKRWSNNSCKLHLSIHKNEKHNNSRLANPSSAVTSNDNTAITIHTTNSIQGNSSNIIKLLPVIRKAIASSIVNAIFMAKGSVQSTIPVNVNAKIINQLADGRVDTTQGIDMTNRLIATELINAINLITTNNDLPLSFASATNKSRGW